ncbi:MAG: ribonuclease HI [Proteobacteria bacterium]|nr:ribonuclease HI [Pseudomonadota bacterium]
MCFKNNKIWLATDQSGNPVVKNGKVLIKYQVDQDYDYWVHEKNVLPLESLKSKSKDPAKKIAGPNSAKNHIDHETEIIDDSILNGAVCIFTDGASSGNPGPSGIGVVLQYGKHQKEISRNIGIATNNIAELEAIRVGLSELKNTKLPVRVFTDSKYAYGVLILGWKAKKNIELVNSIKKAISKFKDLKIIKVKGHAGIKGNERADHLATSAIKK